MADNPVPSIRSRRGPSAPPRTSRGSLLSLRARVLLGYLVLFVVFGFALGTALLVMGHTQERLTLLKEGYLPVAREVGGAGATPLGLQLKLDQSPEVLYGVHRTEAEFMALKRKRLAKALARVQDLQAAPYAVAEAEDLALLRGQLEGALAHLDDYETAHTAFVQAVEQGEPAGGFVTDLLALKGQVNVSLKRIDRRVELKITRVVSKTERSRRSSAKALLTLSSIAFAIGLFLLVSMNIHLRPIRQLIVGAERIREGSFDERVPAPGRDDIGRLARSFNAMAASLEERDRKLKERSQELETALSDLETSQEALLRTARLATIGQMAAQIAHEVRNPLNALGLNADLLVDEVDGGNRVAARELIEAIRNEIRRLTDITEAYLELGRLPPLKLESCQLGGLVDELLRFQGEELEQANIDAQSEISDELPEVLIDRAQLRQALLNIVRNASEAMRSRGGGTLQIRARLESGEVALEITDDGPGIEGDVVSRIFDPFFSTKDTGSGLGLPITHQVIAEHGGRIECRSRPGEGTTFSIFLPCATTREASQE